MNLLTVPPIIDRLKRLSPRIHDINFTHRMRMQTNDAHGVFISESENERHLSHVLKLQEATGIPVSPVFNNIYSENSRDSLDVFCDAFQKLFNLGIRSVTIPHVLWMKFGEFRQRFPSVAVKNTVLRRVRSGQDFWNHAEAGFDYVNIDRILVRDRRALLEIWRAKRKFKEITGRDVIVSLLHGEGCNGACPLWEEHYQHTLTSKNISKDFKDSIDVFRLPKAYACEQIGDTDARALRIVGLPPFLDDLEEVCRYVDVIKLPGRKSFYSLADCLMMVEKFYDFEEPLLPNAPVYIRSLAASFAHQGLIGRWRDKTRTCRYQCWGCDMCSEIIAEAVCL